MAIQLGTPVKDKITGFSGVCTGRADYLSGCSQYLIAPPISKDGSLRDSAWFDEQRLEIVKGAVVSLDNSKTPGPDREAPKR